MLCSLLASFLQNNGSTQKKKTPEYGLRSSYLVVGDSLADHSNLHVGRGSWSSARYRSRTKVAHTETIVNSSGPRSSLQRETSAGTNTRRPEPGLQNITQLNCDTSPGTASPIHAESALVSHELGIHGLVGGAGTLNARLAT